MILLGSLTPVLIIQIPTVDPGVGIKLLKTVWWFPTVAPGVGIRLLKSGWWTSWWQWCQSFWCRRCSKCSKSRDLIAIAICDSNRESQITSDLRQCEPSQKIPMFWLVVQEFGIAILTAIWTEVQITNRAIWKCDLSCPRQRFGGTFLRFGLRDFKSLAICDLWFGALRRCCCSHCCCRLVDVTPFRWSVVNIDQTRWWCWFFWLRCWTTCWDLCMPIHWWNLTAENCWWNLLCRAMWSMLPRCPSDMSTYRGCLLMTNHCCEWCWSGLSADCWLH